MHSLITKEHIPLPTKYWEYRAYILFHVGLCYVADMVIIGWLLLYIHVFPSAWY